MKSKLSIYLLITILLIAGGFLVWSGFGQEIVDRLAPSPTPTPDPYVGWQTYTNEEYGFSLEFPTEMSLSKNTIKNNNNQILFGSYASEFQKQGTELYDGYVIHLAYVNWNPSINYQDLINYVFNDNDWLSKGPVSEVTHNNMKIKIFTYQDYGGPVFQAYLINKDEHSFIFLSTFSVSDDLGRKMNYDNTLTKIINSFRFD